MLGLKSEMAYLDELLPFQEALELQEESEKRLGRYLEHRDRVPWSQCPPNYSSARQGDDDIGAITCCPAYLVSL
jgi:hypothetical protein